MLGTSEKMIRRSMKMGNKNLTQFMPSRFTFKSLKSLLSVRQENNAY